MHTARFVLGSNVEPIPHLREAVALLGEFGDVVAVSAAYESGAFGIANAPNYLNAAVELHTDLTATAIRETAVPSVEERVRGTVSDPPGCRSIDVDLVLYDDAVLTVGDHVLPEPELLLRPYLIVPLAEIAGDVVHPTEGIRIADIAARLDDGTVHCRDNISLLP